MQVLQSRDALLGREIVRQALLLEHVGSAADHAAGCGLGRAADGLLVALGDESRSAFVHRHVEEHVFVHWWLVAHDDGDLLLRAGHLRREERVADALLGGSDEVTQHRLRHVQEGVEDVGAEIDRFSVVGRGGTVADLRVGPAFGPGA